MHKIYFFQNLILYIILLPSNFKTKIEVVNSYNFKKSLKKSYKIIILFYVSGI